VNRFLLAAGLLCGAMTLTGCGEEYPDYRYMVTVERNGDKHEHQVTAQGYYGVDGPGCMTFYRYSNAIGDTARVATLCGVVEVIGTKVDAK
jgi:hypothetical protein